MKTETAKKPKMMPVEADYPGDKKAFNKALADWWMDAEHRESGKFATEFGERLRTRRAARRSSAPAA